jgi:hypothetical protein
MFIEAKKLLKKKEEKKDNFSIPKPKPILTENRRTFQQKYEPCQKVPLGSNKFRRIKSLQIFFLIREPTCFSVRQLKVEKLYFGTQTHRT